MHQRHIELLHQTAITEEDLQATTVTLRGLERFLLQAAEMNTAAA